MLGAGGRGGEGWVAQFPGWRPDSEKQKGRTQVTLCSHMSGPQTKRAEGTAITHSSLML